MGVQTTILISPVQSASISLSTAERPCTVADECTKREELNPFPNGPFTPVAIAYTVAESRVTCSEVARSTAELPRVLAYNWGMVELIVVLRSALGLLKSSCSDPRHTPRTPFPCWNLLSLLMQERHCFALCCPLQHLEQTPSPGGPGAFLLG